MMGTYNRWNTIDEQILRDFYPSAKKSDLLSPLSHKSWTAIQHRAERLRIKRDPKFQFEGMIKNTIKNNPMKNRMTSIKQIVSLSRKGINPNAPYARMRLLELFHNKCELCHCYIDEKTVVVHHKDKNRSNNRLINFLVVCHHCHNIIHERTSNFGIHRCRTSRIIKTEEIGEIDTYDISTPKYHNFLLRNGVLSHNSLKSGVNLELATFMDKNFSADKIGFTDQEFLDLVSNAPQKSFCMRDEITSAGTYGIGSSRVQSFLTIQTETLRQQQISIATISPTEKPLGTAHYILHSIGCNKFELDDEGMAVEPVYVLVGVMNPATHNYLGSVIFEIDWMSKIWKEYQIKKNGFLKKVQEQNFAKADMGKLAEACLKDPLAKYARKKHDWLIIIQRCHPSLTTEEMQMVFAMIKMQARIEDDNGG